MRAMRHILVAVYDLAAKMPRFALWYQSDEEQAAAKHAQRALLHGHLLRAARPIVKKEHAQS